MTNQWHPPGAGQWQRDEVHIPTVMTGFVEALLIPAQQAGFAAGFAHYGAMIAGFDVEIVAGRAYSRPRIAGAPPRPIWGEKVPAKIPGPGKPPPKLVMKLLFKLHPEMRRRARRAAEVWEKRVWREDTRVWFDELRGPLIETNRELTRLDLPAMDDAVLATHLETVTERCRTMWTLHFTHAPMPAVVVGDFLARATAWTGATPSEILATLQGASPASRAGAVETAKIASAIAADPSARGVLESTRADADIVAALLAHPGEIGRLVTAYLEEHGLRPITGLDIYHEPFIALPEMFVRALRASVAAPAAPADTAIEAVAALRARVPAAEQAEFDEAYAEACVAYGVRDDDVGILGWHVGLVYRAVREAGRRLAARKAIHDATHAYDARPDELPALLRDATKPTADELAARAKRRAELDAIEPPFTLGEDGPMPSLDSFPPAVARMQRAVMMFLDAMNGTRAGQGGTAIRKGDVSLEGTPVSAGVYEGRARLVRSGDDFHRIERGDVLVTRATSPAYNVLLPLLGGIVTERGGLLSHAAIVAREYGIPAVVDTRVALSQIPDGAIVRVDGKTGTVTIVRAPDAMPTDTRTQMSGDQTPEGAAPVNLSDVRTAGRVVTLRAATAAEFGGKAKALAAALEAKLPVPDGIALDADLVARIAAGEQAARDAVTAALEGIPAPWAVRSSAIGEDSANASFAGQHSTVLGVEPAALFDAIASVHASGQTAAAQAYRAKMGVTGVARMGIVIQTLLRPDISGVLFSRDPTAAREGRVIEATWGLGEALVSGLVTPDRYRVAADGKVIERAIGEKDVAVEAQAGGGTAEVEIEGDRVRAACLDDARIAELAQLASRCEQIFGGPQDLEWAVANGRLHLLQSRPVTTSV